MADCHYVSVYGYCLCGFGSGLRSFRIFRLGGCLMTIAERNGKALEYMNRVKQRKAYKATIAITFLEAAMVLYCVAVAAFVCWG